MLAAKLLCGVGEEKLYVDDVFIAYTYKGNDTAGRSINNGTDLAGKGGLVWTKVRSNTYSHYLYDTARGTENYLESSTTSSNTPFATGVTAFNSNGYTLGSSSGFNSSANEYVSWTFRKAPKFFDVVTYTGTGTAGLTVSHSLGIKPGMIIVKRTDTTGNWAVYHQSIAAANGLQLETTSASFASSYWNSTEPTASQFTLGAPATAVNASGGTYVAYIFAHDTSTDGIVQCGAFTTDGSGNATVSLGWEPQYLMVKTSSATGGWFIHDTSRGFNVSGTAYLYANTVGAESVSATNYYKPTANGFVVTAEIPSTTYIYLAIRRSNKPPTVGTQVYNAIARTGTGAAATVTGVGFAPDLCVTSMRSASIGQGGQAFSDRLRGTTKQVYSAATTTETARALAYTSFGMDGGEIGGGSGDVNANTSTYINHFFKRAPGVFDEVCYTGTGANHTESHSLGVAPELWIIKDRSAANDWGVGCTALANTEYMALNATDAKATGATYWNSTYPTASVFSLGTMARVNASTYKYVAYLFATKAGISKVGSYTGTATTNAIDCGFTTGARFVLIKRTDSTGDWYVWDTVRGIIAGNDPYLLLNSTVAEVTSTDYIDPYTSGFELSSTAPAAINASGGTFIYLAFA